MEQSTVLEILKLLRANPPLTIAEISQRLNLTKANIRYHIARLSDNGQIKTFTQSSKQAKNRPGRPAKVFTVSDQVYPDNINELMQIWFSLSGLESETLQAAAQLLAKYFSVEVSQQQSIFQTMNLIITELNRRHYAARWEIKSDGPVLYFHNCPYKSLVTQHPQLCEFDQYLITALTGLKIIPQYTIAKDKKNRCMFSLLSS